MSRRKWLVVAAAALLPAAIVMMTGGEDPAPDASLAESRTFPPSAAVADSRSPLVAAPALEAPNAIARDVPIASPAPAASASDDEPAVRLSVSAPAFIEPGLPHEIVVGIAAPRRARWVDFTVSADPDLLVLRAAAPSERGARGGATPAFEARLSDAENRIAIRFEAGGELSANEATGVAIVWFEGVAPGSATVTVSEIAVSDLAGTAIPIASPDATAQVVVMSGPI